MKHLKFFGVPLLMTVICAFLLHSAYVEVEQRAIEQLNSQQLILARQAAKNLEEFFGRYSRFMNNLAAMGGIVSCDEGGRKILRLFHAVHADEIRSITRVDAQGRVLCASPPEPDIEGVDISYQDHIQRIMQTHRPVVSDVFSAAQGFKAIAFHVPVFSEGEFLGSLGVLIAFDALARKNLEAIRLGDEGYAWMISGKGLELYCPVPGHVGNSVFDNCRDYPEILSMAREMLQGGEGVASYVFDKVRGQSVHPLRKHAVYLPVQLPDGFWSIVVATPESEALSVIQGFKSRWLLVIGVLLLAVAFSSYYSGRIFKILKEEEGRRDAETALRASEAKYRALLETTGTGYVILDVAGRVMDANPEYLRLAGFGTLDEILGRKVTEWTAPHDLPRNAEAVEKCMDLGFVRNLEIEYIAGAGRITPVEINATVLTTPEGPRIISLCRDITVRKQAQNALAESEKRYRLLFDNVNDAVFVHEELVNGLPGKFVEVNDVACRMLGRSREELLEMTPLDIDAPETLRTFPSIVDRAQKDEGTLWEGAQITKDGRRIPVEISNHMFELNGAPMVLTSVRDISERKRSEEERERLENQLRQVRKMEAIGTLAGGIAHDFNNILAIIIGYAELAMGEVTEQSPIHDKMERLLKAAFRARDVVKQILVFSSMKANEGRTLTDIGAVARETVGFLRASLPATIEIRQNIGAETDSVLADPTEIHQALLNLCTNAAQAMENGGVLEIAVEKVDVEEGQEALHADVRPGPYVRLMVTDTGHGMGAAVLDRIFDPYFTTKEIGKGTGLGLAVVQGLVQRHDGVVDVRSEPGKGTTFRIYMPRRCERFEPQAPESAPAPRGKEQVLIVDDEASVVHVVGEMLRNLGYRVDGATSPAEALVAFRKAPGEFDLVITDFTMPGMTGTNLAREIMNIRADTRVILCTGYNEKIDEEKALQAGIRAFVMKPLNLHELAHAVRKVLDE